ncbi:hypothetical protein ACJQWK_11782 [Exserohilum turcicum]
MANLTTASLPALARTTPSLLTPLSPRPYLGPRLLVLCHVQESRRIPQCIMPEARPPPLQGELASFLRSWAIAAVTSRKRPGVTHTCNTMRLSSPWLQSQSIHSPTP